MYNIRNLACTSESSPNAICVNFQKVNSSGTISYLKILGVCTYCQNDNLKLDLAIQFLKAIAERDPKVVNEAYYQ